MKHLTLGFLGFGLIGGSIARTLKARGADVSILVYTRRHNPQLDLGVQEGVIDQLVYDIGSEFSSCDVIFLCAPVLTNIKFLEQLKPLISSNCIITDVGSVKGNIHKAVAELQMNRNFIGGHPMAGSEKTGYEHSTTTLLENAYYLLTPTVETSNEHLTRLKSLVEFVGSTCVVLDCKRHDAITAAISHVPHIIAISLVNMVHKSDDSEENMRHFAAGGFKDITRIASSSPDMWESICLSNRDSICEFLDRFISTLQEFHSYLDAEDGSAIRTAFQEAGEYRNSLPKRQSGILAPIHEIFVDVKDETGVLATIATLLANHDISIKNIGIVNNREFEDGALRIELYRQEKKEIAIHLLEVNGYHVISRG